MATSAVEAAVDCAGARRAPVNLAATTAPMAATPAPTNSEWCRPLTP